MGNFVESGSGERERGESAVGKTKDSDSEEGTTTSVDTVTKSSKLKHLNKERTIHFALEPLLFVGASIQSLFGA